MQKEKFEIVSFYKFCPIFLVEGYRISFKKYLIDNSLKGTIILSPEGINGTISGSIGFINEFYDFSMPGITSISADFHKYAYCEKK